MTPAQVVTNRIRLGILGLPLVTILQLISVFLWGDFIDPAVDPEGYAEQVSSTRWAWGDFLSSVGVFFAIFGFVSLYAYLASSRVERLAFAAMILSVVGAAGVMIANGIDSGGAAIAGELYLQGQRAPLEELTNASNWINIFDAVVNRLLFLVGLFLNGIAIWRSGILPQGAGIVWTAAAVLFPASVLGVWGEAVYYVLFTVAVAWVAWSIWHQPVAAIAEAEARPRVQ